MQHPGDQTILIDDAEQGHVRSHYSDSLSSQEEEDDESALNRQVGGGMALRTKFVSSSRARQSAAQEPNGFVAEFIERNKMRRGDEGGITKDLGPAATRKLLDLRMEDLDPATKSDPSNVAMLHGTRRDSPERQPIVQQKGGRVILKLPGSGRPKATDSIAENLQPNPDANQRGIPHIPCTQKRVPSGVLRSNGSSEKDGSPAPPTGKRTPRTTFSSLKTVPVPGTLTGAISPAADRFPMKAPVQTAGEPIRRPSSQLSSPTLKTVTTVALTEGKQPPSPLLPPPARKNHDHSTPSPQSPTSSDVSHFDLARYVPRSSSPLFNPADAGTPMDTRVGLDTDNQSLGDKESVQTPLTVRGPDLSESLNQKSAGAPTPLFQVGYSPQGDFRHPPPPTLDGSGDMARSSPKSNLNPSQAQHKSTQASDHPQSYSSTSPERSKTGGRENNSKKLAEGAESDTSGNIRPTDGNWTELQTVLLDARKILEGIAAKTKTPIKAVVQGLVSDLNVTIASTSPRSDNDYNIWQKYFYRNQEEEEAKSGIKGCSANYAWNIEQQKESETSFKTILQMLMAKESEHSLGNATVGDRKRQYEKLCKRTEKLVEDAREQGFHLTGIIVGNRADPGLGRAIAPSHLPNVWKDKVFVINEEDAISFLQHYVDSFRIQRARDAAIRPQQPKPPNTSDDSDRSGVIEIKSTPAPVKVGKDNTTPIPTKTSKEKLEDLLSELDEKVDPAVICRYALSSALEEASNGKIDCGFNKFYADRKTKVAVKWKTLPRSLADAELVLRGYPVDCRYSVEVEIDKAKAAKNAKALQEATAESKAAEEAQLEGADEDDNDEEQENGMKGKDRHKDDEKRKNETKANDGQGIRVLKKWELNMLATALIQGDIWFEKLTDRSAIKDLQEGKRPVMRTGPHCATSKRKARSVYICTGKAPFVKEDEQPEALPLDDQRFSSQDPEQPVDFPVSPHADSHPDGNEKMHGNRSIPSQAQTEIRNNPDHISDTGATSNNSTTTIFSKGPSESPRVHHAKVKHAKEENTPNSPANTSGMHSAESPNTDIDMDPPSQGGREHTAPAHFPDGPAEVEPHPTGESLSGIVKQHSEDVPVSRVLASSHSQLTNQADPPWWDVTPGPFDSSSALPNHYNIGAESTVVLSRAPSIHGTESFSQMLQQESSVSPYAAPPSYDHMSWRNGAEDTAQGGMRATQDAYIGFRGEPLIGRGFYGANQSSAMANPSRALHGHMIPPINPSHYMNTSPQYPDTRFPQNNMNNMVPYTGNSSMTQYHHQAPAPMQHGEQGYSYWPHGGMPAQGAPFGGFGSWPCNQ